MKATPKKPAEIEVYKFTTKEDPEFFKWCDSVGIRPYWPGYNGDPLCVETDDGESIIGGGDGWWGDCIWVLFYPLTGLVNMMTNHEFEEKYELI